MCVCAYTVFSCAHACICACERCNFPSEVFLFFFHFKVESSRDVKTKLSSLSSIGEASEEKEREGEGEGEGEGAWDLGEPEAVSKLVSMLEGQVSKLDKQLE